MTPQLLVLLLVFAGGSVWICMILADGLRRSLLSAFREHERGNKKLLALQVVEHCDVHQDYLIARLSPTAGKRLPRFRPGQYLTLQVQTDPDCPPSRRCYSLAAWQRRPRYYELCIKREPDGHISPWLHSYLRQGAAIDALPPRGSFVLQKQRDRTLVLVAGGAGIAPLRAMLHSATSLYHRPENLPVILFYAARYQEQLCYLEEFRSLANTHPHFRFYPILSRPGDNWQGMRGRLSAKTLLESVPDAANCLFYICGPPPMLNTLENGLRDAEIDQSSIFCERFRLDGSVSPGCEFKVELEDGTVFWFQDEHTLLDALQGHGVAVASECRTGECGACKIRLAEGQVHEIVKPGAQLKPQEILPCCCIPKSDLKLMVNVS